VRACLSATAAAVAAATLGAATLAGPSVAHHSRANFDLDATVEVEGVVKEFAWRNPHAYVVIETPDGTEWTFEMNSTPVLARFGTTRHSLTPGEHVVAHGNPDRNPDRHFAYTTVFTKDDGTEVWSWGKPDAPSSQPPPDAVFAGSTDFTGVWRIIFEAGFDVLGRNRPDTELHSDLPVTAKGQAQIDAFDPDDNPDWDCLPRTMPTIVGYPYPFEISRVDDDTLKILYEVDHVERTVHMGMSAHPADLEPTVLGHSIGRIDDDGSLVIDTVGFAHVVWGSGEGVDSGERKHTTEVYRLTDDGRGLSLTFTMEDPEYLTEPVTITHRYRLNPDYQIQDYYCDPEDARRHLTAG